MTKIKIIGTSHIASQSVRQIKRAFGAESRPDIVAIELDKARAKQVFEEPILPQFKDVFKMGVTGYTFALVGGFIQRKFGAKVGLKPGEDMRMAISEAKRHALPLFLIDQPLRTTLHNVSKKMGLWEKSKLGLYATGLLFVPIVGLLKRKGKKLDLTKVPSNNLIEESTQKLKKSFPGLYAALVTDRNKHMSRQIKYIATRFPDKRILVVVGAGHKSALEKSLVKPSVAS